MNHDLYAGTISGRAKLWAGLTLATVVAASGVVAIANAESAQHRVQQNNRTQCASSNPCLKRTNTSNGTAIQGTAASGPGLTGISSSGTGVYGTSSSYYGVSGSSPGFYAGVGGFNTSTGSGASGVYGSSQNGPGVTGQTNGATSSGVNGLSQSGNGVSGSSTSGSGVSGSSTSSYGVYGSSTCSSGVYGSSAGNLPTVVGYNTSSSNDASGAWGESVNGTGVLAITDSTSSGAAALRAYGNVYVQGEIYTLGSCQQGCAARSGSSEHRLERERVSRRLTIWARPHFATASPGSRCLRTSRT